MDEDTVACMTGWTTPDTFADVEGTTCSICLDDFEEGDVHDSLVVLLGQCKGHYFHKGELSSLSRVGVCFGVWLRPHVGTVTRHTECIVDSFKHSVKCPICSQAYSTLMGNMPAGTMTVTRCVPCARGGWWTWYRVAVVSLWDGVSLAVWYAPRRYPVGHTPLAGYEDVGTIVARYVFPDGVQDESHPNPGTAYKGTSRRGYLPDTPEGREVAELLVLAFERRQSFTVRPVVPTRHCLSYSLQSPLWLNSMCVSLVRHRLGGR